MTDQEATERLDAVEADLLEARDREARRKWWAGGQKPGEHTDARPLCDPPKEGGAE